MEKIPFLLNYYITNNNGPQVSMVYLRNRKPVPCFYQNYRITSGSLGEREMLWEHEPQATVSTAFSSSSKLSQVSLNSIETQSTCFLFLLENIMMRKRKTTC